MHECKLFRKLIMLWCYRLDVPTPVNVKVGATWGSLAPLNIS